MKNIETLDLHLLLARTDHMNQVYAIAERRNVGVGVLCREVIEKHQEWAQRVFSQDVLKQEDFVHDFIGLLTDDEHFLPRT
jgi:hypothetical protein